MKQSLHISLWSIRDMRLVLAGRTLSFAGDAVALVALMLRVSAEGGPGALSALLLAFALPSVAAIPVAGRIVDRYDSRTVLVIASLLQAAAGAGTALVHGLVPTLAFVCVLQLGQAVAGPAWGALIPRIVGEDLVGRATGTGQALSGLAMLAGSAAGGILVGLFGGRTALLVDASTFAALAVVAMLVRTRRRPEPGSAPKTDGVLAGLDVVFADRLLRLIVPGLWAFVVAGEAINVVEVLLVTGDLRLSAQGYGLVIAVQGAGGIAGAWYAGRVSSDVSRTRAVLAGTTAIGAACLAMGSAQVIVQLVLGAIVCGVAVGLLNAATGALVVTRTPEPVRGRVLAGLNGSARAFSVGALVVGGAAGHWLGARGTFLLGGAGCLVVSALLVPAVGRARAAVPSGVPAGNDSARMVPTH
jgi:MFS family permease